MSQPLPAARPSGSPFAFQAIWGFLRSLDIVSLSALSCLALCLSGLYTGVAQLVEQRIPNPQVAGSTPAARAFFFRRGFRLSDWEGLSPFIIPVLRLTPLGSPFAFGDLGFAFIGCFAFRRFGFLCLSDVSGGCALLLRWHFLRLRFWGLFFGLCGVSRTDLLSDELVMLYRWPQGRIIRVLFLIAVVLIAADFGFNAYGQYDAWSTAEEQDVSNLVYMGILGVLGAVILIGGGVAMIGFVPKAAQFLIEVEQEMSKVTWPSRADLIRSTILIALLSVILALLIAGVDLLNYWLVYSQIIGGGQVMAMHWYVVKAISGRENKARDTIVQKVRQAGLSDNLGRFWCPQSASPR